MGRSAQRVKALYSGLEGFCFKHHPTQPLNEAHGDSPVEPATNE